MSVTVDRLRVGDVIEWCGFAATIVDWKPATSRGWQRPRPRSGRPARYLIVQVTGDPAGPEPRQLHYYDDEHVTLITHVSGRLT